MFDNDKSQYNIFSFLYMSHFLKQTLNSPPTPLRTLSSVIWNGQNGYIALIPVCLEGQDPIVMTESSLLGVSLAH